MLVDVGAGVLSPEGGCPGVGDGELAAGRAAPAAQRLAEAVPEVLRHEAVHDRVDTAVSHEQIVKFKPFSNTRSHYNIL